LCIISVRAYGACLHGPVSSNVRQHNRRRAVLQESQRLRRELNSHNAAEPRTTASASPLTNLGPAQRTNYLDAPRSSTLRSPCQTALRIRSASREALSALGLPLSVSSSARRHRHRSGFAHQGHWRRDDRHHPSCSHRVSPRTHRQSSVSTSTQAGGVSSAA
jgi:hypothetical protein